MSAYDILQLEVESCTEVHICQTCLGYGTRTNVLQVLVYSNYWREFANTYWRFTWRLLIIATVDDFFFWILSWEAGTMSLRHPYNMLPTGLPSNFNSHNPISIFSTPGIRNFGPLDGSGHLSSSSNLHSVLGSGIPGLAATSLDNDIRNYDQRRREFYPGSGIHDHHVKREEVRTIFRFNFIAITITILRSFLHAFGTTLLLQA